MTKICSMCKEDKPLDQFNKRSSSKDGLQPLCRACNREKSRNYYEKNKEDIKKKIYKSRANRKAEVRAWVNDMLVKSGCVDCGYNENPAALDFDHKDIETKKQAISTMVANEAGISAIKEEILKCDIRCANCHRVRTASQMGWYKGIETILPSEMIPSRRSTKELPPIS